MPRLPGINIDRTRSVTPTVEDQAGPHLWRFTASPDAIHAKLAIAESQRRDRVGNPPQVSIKDDRCLGDLKRQAAFWMLMAG